MKSIFEFLGSITYTFLYTIFCGFIFSTLWNWFIVTKFNLPPLRVIEAVGICTIPNFLFLGYMFSYITYNEVGKITDPDKKKITEYSFKAMTLLILFPLALFSGWVIHNCY